MTQRQLLTYAAVTGLLALICGLILVTLRGPLALLLLGLGAFFVLFYTWPLKYIGLGEIAVLIVWGPLMIGGGYFVVTGEWSWSAVLAGLPYALGVTTVIFGKHIDKHDDDKAKRIHTLPVIIGERPSRYIAIAMMVLMYALVAYLILTGYFVWFMLVVFFALTVFRRVLMLYLKPRPAGPPEWYPQEAWPLWFVSWAFLHNRRYGLLFLAGLIGEVVLKLVFKI
jgi:1,4-dihydroxy-2-naphthoate octaprenyltransferase